MNREENKDEEKSHQIVTRISNYNTKSILENGDYKDMLARKFRETLSAGEGI